MMKTLKLIASVAAFAVLASACCNDQKEPVDYVNPYIGNISHLLVPTFATVQLPNSMLRVYPERADFTSEHVNGLPVIVTNHREKSAFKISVSDMQHLAPIVPVPYDNEHLTPYSFSIDLADSKVHADYAVSHQSAVYSISFKDVEDPAIIINSARGCMSVNGNVVAGAQQIDDKTTVYVYMEFDQAPLKAGALYKNTLSESASTEGRNAAVALSFPKNATVGIRYGVSFISQEQAAANLHCEIDTYKVASVAAEGRKIWNETLGRLEVKGATEDQRTVFYTSYYRTFERPVCISEDGRYWSAFDGQVHEDGGTPFYNDDWVWDTYRAAHPLRILMDRPIEEDIVESFLRMADQMGGWLPTFPEINGDSRRMNSNHSVAIVADAIAKGLDVDLDRAYSSCRNVLTEKTLCPWCGNPAGWIDSFYWEHGYIPALRPGEQETDPNVHYFEKRQPIAVTLGTAYDTWCMSLIAAAAGHPEDAQYFADFSQNYKTVYNPATGFFHPKDKDGNFIEPIDYRFAGGLGCRDYYDENNGWVYRWDVQHDIPGLIALMGGNEQFVKNLDAMFAEPLGKGKFEFYSQIPDHTGNVGQFSMANEPSLHIPYLYNYAGAPWKTQKRIRQMLKTWFRNDLMGVPGDEDGGGLTSFVVMSSLGIYPVTPGSRSYEIGSPLFEESKIHLENGKTFTVVAKNASDDNKYIQSATLNGKPYNTTHISHDDIMAGGKLVLVMGSTPNKTWGTDEN